MTENLLKTLSDERLLALTSETIEDYSVIIVAPENKESIDKKHRELSLLHKIIQERGNF